MVDHVSPRNESTPGMDRDRHLKRLFTAILCVPWLPASACLNSYTFTASPLPVNGTYECGQTVNFCFTVTNWTQQNSNWFHGLSIALGPGWDASTLTPVSAPPPCQGTGSWDWYASVTGTGNNNIGPQGPGWFFNTGAPGNPGNNYGDNCAGAVNWQFCWSVTVMSTPDCVGGADLSVTVDTFGDSETGSWGSAGCHNDPIPTGPPATVENCPSAGLGNNVVFCSAGSMVPLAGQLLGAPDAGGAWTGPGGSSFSGNFNPASDPPGNYTYTVSSTAPPCFDTATVSINVVQQPSAGGDSSLTLCADATAFLLIDALGGSPGSGGTWAAPGGGPSAGTFTPGQSADGAYTYSIPVSVPCVSVTSTVTITTFAVPGNAGSDSSIVLCSSDEPVALIGLLGGFASGGSWSAPGGAPFGGTLAPATGASGIYAYVVTPNGPCPGSSSQVDVTIHQAPDAGSDGSVVLCSSEQATVPLAGLLGGTPDTGGTWTAPDGTMHGPDFVPGTDLVGSYTYTVSGIAPCTDASANVVISIVQASDAGTGGMAALCQGDTVFDPMAWLAGTPDPNGTWSAPGGGTLVQVDPMTAASGLYIYTVPGTAPCPAAQAVMDVVVAPLPDAGADGVLTLCINGNAQALFDALGGTPDPTGLWSGPSVPVGGMFTPGVQQAGAYTYTAPGLGACAGLVDSSEVLVQVVPLPVPSVLLGNTDGCLPFSLSPQLLGPADAATASWSFGDGAVLAGLPQVEHTYTNAGTYQVMVTVTDTAGCSGTAVLPVLVHVSAGPVAHFLLSTNTVGVDDAVVQVYHDTLPSVSYAWTLDGQPVAGAGNFTLPIDPPTIGYHLLCLEATDTLGCPARQCRSILVDDNLSVYVANAFTPDGDGLNDGFLPVVLGVEPGTYQLRVFDRWGQEMFSTDDPQQAWTGLKGQDGGVLPQGVYVWRIAGRDRFTTDQREWFGMVTLLR